MKIYYNYHPDTTGSGWGATLYATKSFSLTICRPTIVSDFQSLRIKSL